MHQQEFTPDDDYTNTIRFGPLLIEDEEVVNHMLIFGATGSGKTTLIRLLLQDIVPQIAIEDDWRLMITNPKRDAFSVLHGIAPSGVRIVTTDPFDARGVAWDMCRDIREPRTALQLAFTLIPNQQESQPFFSNAARHIVYGVLLSFLDRKIEWTFADLLRAVQNPIDLKRILRASPYSKHVIDQYFYDRRLASNVLSTVASWLLPFGPVAACWETASESISLEDWVRQRFVIVLGISDESRQAVDVINRCMFRRASELILSQTESDSRRTFVILDEVSECGKLDGLVSLLKRGRSKGASVLLAAQSIAGLRAPEMYGPHGTAELVGQVMHKGIGRLECPETAKWASEVIGDQEITQTTHSRSQSYGAQGSSTTSSSNEQVVTRSAVLLSEFMELSPCNDVDGLAGFYVSAAYGAFSATLSGPELFSVDLIPRCRDVDDFIPRPVAAQYLSPWSDSQRAALAPRQRRQTTKKTHRPEPKPETSPSPFEGLEEL